MTKDHVDAIVKRTMNSVEMRKADLAAWREQYSPVQQIEVRLAMLETVLHELVDQHGEFDAAEIVELAMRRAVANARGPLQ